MVESFRWSVFLALIFRNEKNVRNNLSRIVRTIIQDIFYSNVNFYISLDIIQFHKLRISFLIAITLLKN